VTPIPERQILALARAAQPSCGPRSFRQDSGRPRPAHEKLDELEPYDADDPEERGIGDGEGGDRGPRPASVGEDQAQVGDDERDEGKGPARETEIKALPLLVQRPTPGIEARRRAANLDQVAQDLFTSAASVMTASTRISEVHRGQTNGLTSYTWAISRAHAEREADSGRVRVGGSGYGLVLSCSCVRFHPSGA